MVMQDWGQSNPQRGFYQIRWRCSLLAKPVRICGMNFNRQELTNEAASLAVQAVHIGTSSRKRPGWSLVVPKELENFIRKHRVQKFDKPKG